MTAPVTRRFQDEVDAARAGGEWIDDVARRRGMVGNPEPGSQITRTIGRGGGGVITLWRRARPIAMAVCVRDEMNYTVLIHVEVEVVA